MRFSHYDGKHNPFRSRMRVYSYARRRLVYIKPPRRGRATYAVGERDAGFRDACEMFALRSSSFSASAFKMFALCSSSFSATACKVFALRSSSARSFPGLRFRHLITPPTSEPDGLLQVEDLPPKDVRYLKPVPRDEYTVGLGIMYADVPARHRWAIVLPLEIRDNLVVPIPFIIDTGAPNFMYLGSGCRRVLADLGVLVDTAAGASYRLKGVMRRGDFSVTNPPAWDVPEPHEGLLVVGDVRVNLLGLNGLKKVGAKHSFDE